MLERSDSFFNNNGTRFETVIWTAKLMLLSIGFISTFLLLKVAVVPCIFQSIMPTCFLCFRACLAPPYIYIIVNFIIISIAASSSSAAAHKSTSDANYEEQSSFLQSSNVKVLAYSDTEIEDSDAEVKVVVKHEVITCSGNKISPPEAEEDEEREDDGYDDSLDGTWKAIMEGKGTVKKTFLKKSDTMNNTTRAPPAFPLAERVSNDQNHNKSEMRKSETFNDRVTTLRASGGVRRETVLTSQDSLNARVEAFINKFQNDMRMERQRSDMRYINLVKQQAAAT